MTMSDPIADMLTRIRNANTAIGSLIAILNVLLKYCSIAFATYINNSN